MKKACLLLLALCAVSSAFGQAVIPLYEGTPPNTRPAIGQADSAIVAEINGRPLRIPVQAIRPTLTAFLPARGKATGMAVIICPGGAYLGLAVENEGDDIARRFSEAGIAGFVLHYRLPDARFVTNKELVPLQDAQRALQLVREGAAHWGINPHKVGLLGSSAGGHVAVTAGTQFETAYIDNPRRTSLRPDFLILNYPVISFADNLANPMSRLRLIGPPVSAAWLSRAFTVAQGNPQQLAGALRQVAIDTARISWFSAERHVTPQTPPTFLTHALDDPTVPVANTLLFGAALQQNRVPVQTFFYAKGGHGYGIRNPTAAVQWPEACLQWLTTLEGYPVGK